MINKLYKTYLKLRENDLIKYFLKRLPIYNYYQNVFGTKYSKTVLISYITYPLRKETIKVHSNILELYSLLEVFKSLNFNIDVCNYTYEGKINYEKYDIIFGFGFPFGKSFIDKSAKYSIKICYLTGSLRLFNQMERIKYLKERKKVVLRPRRNYYWPFIQESISMSDGIIVTGNEWTASTVKPYNSNVFPVRLPVFLPDKNYILKIIQDKDFKNAKYKFVWFGSSGAIHKGLDLCLDIFAQNENLFLHVCGPVDKEEDFWSVYKKELTELANIKYHGFVNIDSNLFEDIIRDSTFAIFPSCSEGTGGSLLTCMAHGLIPISTREAGVNISQDYGFLLEDYKIEYIKQKINEILSLKEEKLKEMSIESLEFTHKNHSVESYQQDVINALKKMGVV